MPFDQQIVWEFPIKGKDTNFGLREEPQGTCADCLNVLPHDIATGRARGGQRGGLAKVYTTQLGGAGGGQSVQGILCTTIAVDPSQAPATNIEYEEIWAYTDGALLQSTGIPWITGDSVWAANTWATISNPNPGVTPGAVKGLTTGGKNTQALYTGNFGIPANYTIKGTFTFSQLGSPVGAGNSYLILFRYDRLNPSGNGGLDVAISTANGGTTTTVNIDDPGHATLLTTAGPTLTEGQVFTLEARVTGNTCAVFVNGTSFGSVSIAGRHTGQTAVGFAVSCGGVAIPAQRMNDFQILVPTSATYRQSWITAFAGGNGYRGDLSSTTLTIDSGGTNGFAQGVAVRGCYLDQTAYFVDGTNFKKLDLVNGGFAAVVATAGVLPTLCQLCCIWRGRLVLASPQNNGSTFFMARVGTPTDFDYSQLDPARAIAGNAGASFGKIGDNITALIPFGDDILLFGCDHSLFAMVGDPAAGGVIDHFCDGIGIYGQDAWCMDPSGTVYFVGQGGFYSITKGSTVPTPLSKTVINDFFTAINRKTQSVRCVYDRDAVGVRIFVVNIATGGTQTGLWFDARTGGFFPEQFPDAMVPTATGYFDGDGSTQRMILLGGRDGFLRSYGTANADDDGTAISSFVYLGPLRPVDDLTEGKVNAIDFWLGQEDQTKSYNLNWQLQSAPDAWSAVFNPVQTAAGTFGQVQGHQTTQRARVRGGSFAMKLSNSTDLKTWNMERVVLQLGKGGRQR